MNSNDRNAGIPSDVEIAILGAGIGGLAAAIALRGAGFDVHVYEGTEVLREVGGAVVIREPSVRLFEKWGFRPAFAAQAVPINVMAMYDAAGNLQRTVKADLRGDGQAYSVHRADVYGLLLAAVPREKIHLGMTATSVVNTNDHAVAHFADGTHVRARLIVGADGIRSVTRAAIADDELVFSHLVVLRGIAPASALPTGMSNDRVTIWSRGEAQHMICLPLRAGLQVAMDTIMTWAEPPSDLWNTEVPVSTLLEHFAGFDPGLLRLIEAGTKPIVANPVYDREPLNTWSAGRITLLGDAAHPMEPLQGQGANQAVQDAEALAAELATCTLANVPKALGRYEALRIPPTREIQLASRKRPEFVSVGR